LDEAKRLFCAISFDPATVGRILAAQARLRPCLRKARPTAPGNVHLTLEFIGGCDRDQEARATEALAESCAETAPFSLARGELGHFPKRGGCVVWQGVAHDEGYERLCAFQLRLKRHLEAHGFDLPDNAFAPHITLFRGAVLLPPRTEASLPSVLSEADARLPGWRQEVTSAALIWSHRAGQPEALVYEPTARFGLRGPAR
jgi:2'-5' RNA ligase